MLDALLDLVLPRCCAGCHVPGGRLCAGCAALLAAPPLGPVRPDPCPAGLPEVRALARYDGEVKRLLLVHKERGGLDLSRVLGDGLGAAVADLDPGPLVLCPVPSSRSAIRERGYDHAWRLATAAARSRRRAGAPVVARRLLAPTRRTADQAGLSTAQRAANLRGALVAVPASTAARVVVVDDVMTTGATLAEAARALRAAGHNLAGAAVLAATNRRRTVPVLPISIHPDLDGR